MQVLLVCLELKAFLVDPVHKELLVFRVRAAFLDTRASLDHRVRQALLDCPESVVDLDHPDHRVSYTYPYDVYVNPYNLYSAYVM